MELSRQGRQRRISRHDQRNACSALLAACALPFLPLPAAESLPWLALTIVLHLGYFASLISAIGMPISLAYPLMRLCPRQCDVCGAIVRDSLAPSMIAGHSDCARDHVADLLKASAARQLTKKASTSHSPMRLRLRAIPCLTARCSRLRKPRLLHALAVLS